MKTPDWRFSSRRRPLSFRDARGMTISSMNKERSGLLAFSYPHGLLALADRPGESFSATFRVFDTSSTASVNRRITRSIFKRFLNP
jgi:hypothetical protein